MTHTTIPSTAIQAGKSLSRHLAETMRANRLYCDHVDQANTAMLNNATGHRHQEAGSRTLTYTYTDRVKITSGANDRLDFKFREGGASATISTVAASLTPATYTLTSLASHIQTQMRSAASTSSIDVSYQGPSDESPGHFVIRHSGTTSSPNTQVLQLLCSTGTNGPGGNGRSVFPDIGFAQGRDRVGALGYRGDGGFLDGFTQDQFTWSDGETVGASGIASNAVTTAKIKDGIITGAKIKDTSTEAVSGAKVASGAITGPKSGQPVTSSIDQTIGSGSTSNLTFVMPNGGSGRSPRVTVVCTTTGQDEATYGGFEVSAPVHSSGNTWTVAVKNWATSTLTFRGFAY